MDFHKIRIAVVILLLLVASIFGGVIIYAYKTTESPTIIIETIRNCDSTNIKSIEILPYHKRYQGGNLVDEPILISDKKTIAELLQEMKVFEPTDDICRWAYWKGYMKINFVEPSKLSLKNKSYILFEIYSYRGDGVYYCMTNVMGSSNYWRPELKSKLEKLANFK